MSDATSWTTRDRLILVPLKEFLKDLNADKVSQTVIEIYTTNAEVEQINGHISSSSTRRTFNDGLEEHRLLVMRTRNELYTKCIDLLKVRGSTLDKSTASVEPPQS